MVASARLLLVCALLLPWTHASAHGIHAHIHVTGWAIEALPESEIRDFFSEPEVMNAALFGAAFTDSGYWPLNGEMGPIARAYSEHTHWEPFIQDVVEWIRLHDPPPWTSLESRKRVAFFMGCASHGMQDELFDSLFLDQVHRHDGGDQDTVDPASDGFLAIDEHLRFYPERFVPMEALLTLYSGLEVEVTEEVIEAAVDKMITVYVNDGLGPDIATEIGQASVETLAWTYDHYMDLTIPGSLRSEIAPTMGYLEVIWARIHGTFDPNTVVVATYPAPSLRLLGVAADTPDSWVTFVYGAGVMRDGPAHLWTDADDVPVAFARHGTRWGADWTRLHSLRPAEDLPGGTWMKATLPVGTTLIDGGTTTDPTTHGFQTPCDAPDDVACQGTPTDAETVAQAPSSTSTSSGCGQPSSPGHPLWLSLALLALVSRRCFATSAR